MRSLEALVALYVLSCSTVSSASHIHGAHHLHARRAPRLHARSYVTQETVAESYDFIIAGGGLAGLVLAARLSENPSTKVLVLEAGDSGDAVADRINSPGGAYYQSLLYTPYDWQYKTIPQPQAGNRAFDWPRGKVLGGSSAVNAMYLVRPSETEVNEWEKIIAGDDPDAAKPWGWARFYESMKRSETFTPPLDDSETGGNGNMTWSAATHGTSGPMQVSYPAFVMSQVNDWLPALASLGIPPLQEPNGGTTLGGLVGPSWINPANLTRSYSKAAYLDPVLHRPNLAVLVNATATRVVFADAASGELTATGVEFAGSADGPRTVVGAGREVILAGGVVGSPQILMLSGVGPRDVLEAAGVEVKVELPGVGQHLQDHLTAGVVWESTAETAGNISEAGSEFAKSPKFLSFINAATAWVNLTRLFDSADAASAFQASIAAGLADAPADLVPSTAPEVIAGYRRITDVVVNKILNTDLAVVELLLATNSPGVVSVQAAIQHPLSQGRLYINTSSAFDPPVIDPQYFTHPADLTIMRQGIKLVRALAQAPPFNNSLGAELAPGPAVGSDEQIEQWLVAQAGTQYHPIASCAMLPRSEGGVVDARLRVYGLANVRVVDASVYPFEFASHVGASTYGLAEQASDLILVHNGIKNAAAPARRAAGGVWAVAGVVLGLLVLGF